MRLARPSRADARLSPTLAPSSTPNAVSKTAVAIGSLPIMSYLAAGSAPRQPLAFRSRHSAIFV